MTLFRMLLLLPNVTLRLALFITCYIGLVIPSIAQQEEPAINGTLALKELQAFVNAFTQIRNTYVEEVDDKTLLENAIKGMLTELDPHSNYLAPQTYKNLQVSATGEFGGLGLEVGMEDGFVKVISPIDDTPAQKAGIESGDLIVKIDNKPVKGLSLNEAVKLMRGKIGTSIELTVAREGNAQPLEFSLERAVISVVSVRSKVLEKDYLYLRIAQFQANTGVDLRKVIDQATQAQAPNGIVLDLRNNPGGVLQAAVDVVDTFISEGLIVYTEGRIQTSATRFVASGEATALDVPLVILINGGSASASEIVAGALQDHKRAIVLGTTSFGKGSVQSVIPLSETHGMKLTTARYFTPNGRSIQAQGIVPDIIVERGKFTPLKSRVQVTEADLPRHLQNGGTDSADQANTKNSKRTDAQKAVTNDAQLHEAITLLKGLHILSQRGSQPTISANSDDS
ncbi:S41 family peptidase [Pseudomonadales bacterium]|nr:S41 family peptidase [Pseudomonadales bacterium]MDB4090324.1 S41 family peptidase [Pseudomonadales bacterium]MDB4363014.1 S41 family peptidase [Pseudomonadales bacterium]MDB4421153.1 S41 family peptidase [Pseudomonadales bacterium]MDB4452623.1 S41 family peptidase [bacterium]